MLHVRLVVPADLAAEVLDRLTSDKTVCNVVTVPDASQNPDGHLVLCDVARENASVLVESLREIGVDERGSIGLDEAGVVISRAADQAEESAPGRPVDAVIWDAIETQASEDSRMAWSYLAFLVLAMLIAGVGRYLDQPILIVGAMVVGPEFAPVSAICFGLARRRGGLARQAASTLVGGFAAATLLASIWWGVAHMFGWIHRSQARTGPLTEFIVSPDAWSFVIALLAGVAGVLSLTTAKSATLVGVFISVTTVPAAGAVALTVATGLWHEAASSAIQLGVNLTGMIFSGTATLLVQQLIWARILPPRALVHLRGRAAIPSSARRAKPTPR